MDNQEAQAYAILTIKELIRHRLDNTDEHKIYQRAERIMKDIMDFTTESEAVEQANRILRGE